MSEQPISSDVSEPTAVASVPYTKPLPDTSGVAEPFWQAAKEHRLLLQRSKKTGRAIFYPRPVSPFGPKDELEWFEATGKGTVYSYTVARRPTAPQWANEGPLVIAIVEMSEGARMTTNIVECDPDLVHIGMAVEAVFEDVTPEVTLVKFRPVRAATE